MMPGERTRELRSWWAVVGTVICGSAHWRLRGVDTTTRESSPLWLHLGDRHYHYVVALLPSPSGGENGADWLVKATCTGHRPRPDPLQSARYDVILQPRLVLPSLKPELPPRVAKSLPQNGGHATQTICAPAALQELRPGYAPHWMAMTPFNRFCRRVAQGKLQVELPSRQSYLLRPTPAPPAKSTEKLLTGTPCPDLH